MSKRIIRQVLYHQKPLTGVRGRLQVRSYENNEETKYITEVIVEKVSFLSSKKEIVETTV